jgi:hypothetical protein
VLPKRQQRGIAGGIRHYTINTSIRRNSRFGASRAPDKLRALFGRTRRGKRQARLTLADLSSQIQYQRMNLETGIPAKKAREHFRLLLLIANNILPARQRHRNRVQR